MFTKKQSNRVAEFVENEIANSKMLMASEEFEEAFVRLERAHVVGQGSTYQHTRVHLRMLAFGWKVGSWREVFGQFFRVAGASTKTPLGIYPKGNTGGANVSPFRSMPIPEDLQIVLSEAGES